MSAKAKAKRSSRGASPRVVSPRVRPRPAEVEEAILQKYNEVLLLSTASWEYDGAANYRFGGLDAFEVLRAGLHGRCHSEIRILDVGCGAGGFLREVHKRFPKLGGFVGLTGDTYGRTASAAGADRQYHWHLFDSRHFESFPDMYKEKYKAMFDDVIGKTPQSPRHTDHMFMYGVPVEQLGFFINAGSPERFFGGKKFDFIFVSWTLVHMVDPIGMLSTMYRLLKPGSGVLLGNTFVPLFHQINSMVPILTWMESARAKQMDICVEDESVFMVHNGQNDCLMDGLEYGGIVEKVWRTILTQHQRFIVSYNFISSGASSTKSVEDPLLYIENVIVAKFPTLRSDDKLQPAKWKGCVPSLLQELSKQNFAKDSQKANSTTMASTATGRDSVPHDAKEIIMCFERFDANGDGKIDRQDLERVLLTCSQTGQIPYDFDQLFKAADVNKDGAIDYEEFCRWVFSDAEGAKVFHDVEMHSNTIRSRCWTSSDVNASLYRHEHFFGMQEVVQIVFQKTHKKRLHVLDLNIGQGECLVLEIAAATDEEAGKPAVISVHVFVANVDHLMDVPHEWTSQCNCKEFDIIVNWDAATFSERVCDPLGVLCRLYNNFLAPGGTLLIGGMTADFLYEEERSQSLLWLFAWAAYLEEFGSRIDVRVDSENSYCWWLQRKAPFDGTSEDLSELLSWPNIGLGPVLAYNSSTEDLKAVYEICKPSSTSFFATSLPAFRERKSNQFCSAVRFTGKNKLDKVRLSSILLPSTKCRSFDPIEMERDAAAADYISLLRDLDLDESKYASAALAIRKAQYIHYPEGVGTLWRDWLTMSFSSAIEWNRFMSSSPLAK